MSKNIKILPLVMLKEVVSDSIGVKAKFLLMAIHIFKLEYKRPFYLQGKHCNIHLITC